MLLATASEGRIRQIGRVGILGLQELSMIAASKIDEAMITLRSEHALAHDDPQ
jgi:hypothetical protein